MWGFPVGESATVSGKSEAPPWSLLQGDLCDSFPHLQE